MFRVTVLEDSSVDWRDLYRNDASSDVVAVSVAMSAGTSGNVLTWTGSINLVEQPAVEYREGGYRTIVGEFVSLDDAAALTLTQS